MKDDLAVTDRKVVDLPTLGKSIGSQVVPNLFTEVTLGKIDMDDAYFCLGFVRNAGTLFLYIGNVKIIKDSLGENHAGQGGIYGVC